MEHLVANLSGGIRREKLGERDYIVAKLTLIVPGVLNGSKGPLLYPADETPKNAMAWNHMPMLVYHPTKDGVAISGRDPEIIDKHRIGFVFNSEADAAGVLGAEGWFDVLDTKRIDPRILNKLERNEAIELSTGLFTDNSPAHAGAVFNGVQYVEVARNYRPDHLAILPDQTGACSLRHGCGVNNQEDDRQSVGKSPLNNSKGKLTMPLTKEDRENIIGGLTLNCACNDADKAALATLSDETLSSLAQNAMDAEDPEEDAAADEEVPEDAPPVKKKAPPPYTGNSAAPKPQTDEQWLQSAPPSIRAVVLNAMKAAERDKAILVEQLTANTDPAYKPQAVKFLSAKSLDELQFLAALQPTVNQQAMDVTPNYFGASGAPPVFNARNKTTGVNKDDTLIPPVINWGEVAAAK